MTQYPTNISFGELDTPPAARPNGWRGAACLLPTAYFAPVQWWQKAYRYGTIYIEQHDHFAKQTFRNRCVIATTNGLQPLTVPVERPEGGRLDKTPVREVRVSDHGEWRKQHWNALCSAYGESPFFEFYADDLQPFFTRKWEFLFDFNMAITHKMCELLGFQPTIVPTTEYGVAGSTNIPAEADFREAIHPKHPLPDPDFTPTPYYQVYRQRHGFQPNLSILDLLCNMGNEAVLYL